MINCIKFHHLFEADLIWSWTFCVESFPQIEGLISFESAHRSKCVCLTSHSLSLSLNVCMGRVWKCVCMWASKCSSNILYTRYGTNGDVGNTYLQHAKICFAVMQRRKKVCAEKIMQEWNLFKFFHNLSFFFKSISSLPRNSKV